MALPFKCRILFFCLVLLMGCTSGVRNTIKQDSEACDQVYATTYGTGTANGEKEVEVENAHKENPTYAAQYGGAKETNQPYVTSYGGGKETKPPYIAGYGGFKETNQPYVTSYGGAKETNQPYIPSYKGARETNQPYVTSYRGKKETNQPYTTSYGDTGETNHPYVTSYGGEKETNRPYITSYGDEETNLPYITTYRGPKETKPPYITGYRDAEEKNRPYITSYEGSKETNKPYITAYGEAKETNHRPYTTRYGNPKAEHPYITGYNDPKETNQSYITAHGDAKENNHRPYISGYPKETNQSYITAHGDAKENNHRPYISGYGNPKAKHPYITGYNDPKETNQPYITAYGDTKENNRHPYITGYRNTKADQHPYITRYNDAKEKKEHLYISAYGDSKETNERSPFFGNGESQDPRPKCKRHMHAGHNHMIGHANHMHTQPSTGMDHTEAFKIGFFTPDDLYAGKIMPLYFPIKEPSSRFLPREVAESIPFSMSQLPNLLQLFSIPQGSPEAKEMEQTLRECELKPINGEIKLCATSLESMVEFAHSIIGSQVNFNLLSTTHPTLATALTQNYTISETPKQVLAPKMVFCHPEPYPYAVFFCHFFGTETKVFQVALRGESGDDVEAMAACHMDTSDWDPNHVLFSLLGVKPGVSSPVCHFLPKNHLVWIPSPTAATAQT